MEPATARIPTRSRNQAMDWSLVLLSQGIESTIDSAQDGPGWGLVVDARDYTAALRTLRQYQIENRRWPWRQEVWRPGLLFDWGSLAWALLLTAFYWLSQRGELASAGAMDSAAVARGQWWRLFTAIWLHADLAHLASNASIGFVLLGLAMGLYGTGTGLLAAYLAGAGGNVVAWLAAVQPHRSLGASGMVMGGLGLLAAQSFSLWRQTPRARKFILTGIGGGLLLFVLLGVAPGTDIVAHFGGFISGLLLGIMLALFPANARKSKIDLGCGILFALLSVAPWWLAVR